MIRRVVASVRVRRGDGRSVVLAPGEVIPEWAVGQVSNAAAYVDDGAQPGAESAAQSGGDGVDYAEFTVADLKAEIRSRNDDRGEDDRLPLDGAKADLVAALEADDGN